jgi:hypothetical protein
MREPFGERRLGDQDLEAAQLASTYSAGNGSMDFILGNGVQMVTISWYRNIDFIKRSASCQTERNGYEAEKSTGPARGNAVL